MTAPPTMDLGTLFELDETAWLESMAALADKKRVAEMDFRHLSEYLSDMAKRDRREVFSRLVVLMTHLLKWERQPERRTGSWRGTIREQRRELRQLLDSGTLRRHAQDVLDNAFSDARSQAADEAELSVDQFPSARPWSLEELLEESVA